MNRNVFDDNNSINYLLSHRNKYLDLYKSEKFFFNKLNASKTFLDLGCGIGGFLNILEEKLQVKNYTGLDVSKKMINKAKTLHPKSKFVLYDGKNIRLKKKIDAAFSFGTLHYCNNYNSLIRQMFKISKNLVIFDLRLTFRSSIINSSKNYQLIGNKRKVNYNIINFFEALDNIISITKKKSQINIYGYYDYPAKNVRTIYNKILMIMFCIDKRKKFELNINIQNDE